MMKTQEAIALYRESLAEVVSELGGKKLPGNRKRILERCRSELEACIKTLEAQRVLEEATKS